MASRVGQRIVNRSDELRLVAQRLDDRVRGVALRECIINLAGVAGIGKTALLAEFDAQHHSNPAFATLLIDLQPPAGTGALEARRELVQLLQNNLAPGTTRTPEFAHLEDELAIDIMLAQLVAQLQQGRPLLLLIDNADSADGLLPWVEQRLLLPLVRSERLVAVLASRQELRWRQFDVRRRAQCLPLGPLSPEAAEQQLGLNTALASEVYQLAGGHPLATELARRLLEAQPRRMAWPAAERAAAAAQIADGVAARALDNTPAELKTLLRLIAPLREFDVNTLRALLPQYDPLFANRSQAAWLMSIKQLLETRLVAWSDLTRSYRSDPAIRWIFAADLRLNEPERYRQIVDASIGYYQQLVAQASPGRNVALLELLYQRLQAGATLSTLRAELAQLLRQHYCSPDGHYRDSATLDDLHALLAQDHELSALPGITELFNQALADVPG